MRFSVPTGGANVGKSLWMMCSSWGSTGGSSSQVLRPESAS